MTPASILDVFAALMLAVAAISAARLAAARPWQRGSLSTDTDAAHLLMAIAMAGMLAASLTTLPAAAWEVTFALMTAWFALRVVADARANGVRALAGGHFALHLAHSAAMVYMFAPRSAGGSGVSEMGAAPGAAMQALRYPTLAFGFALILSAYSIWDIDQLSGSRYSTAPARMPLARVAAFVPAMAGSAPSAAAETETGRCGGGSDGSGSPAARVLLLSPAVSVGSRIGIGVTMAMMLLLSI
jgi:hypothetical protein